MVGLCLAGFANNVECGKLNFNPTFSGPKVRQLQSEMEKPSSFPPLKISCMLPPFLTNKLVQACLRAPHVVADKAKLSIVFTYFFLLFWSRRACVRHTWWRTKRSWPLFSPTFFFFFFFLSFSFFSAFYFSPTSEKLPCVKISFPQYFGITRRNI